MTLDEAQQLLGVYRTQRDHAERENEQLRKALSRRLQQIEELRTNVHRLSMRCAVLACLHYPNPDAMPREAVPGDIDG